MSTMNTDMWGPQATVGTIAPSVRWSADAVASPARHHLAVRKPMPFTYEVKTINGFDRRPSEGST